MREKAGTGVIRRDMSLFTAMKTNEALLVGGIVGCAKCGKVTAVHFRSFDITVHINIIICPPQHL